MSEPEQQSPEAATGEKMLSLRIGTLNSTSSSSDEITERIKSLRIIILSDGFIEYNQKFDYSQGESAPKKAEGTIETLKRATVAGNKKFYLIANEESVPEIHFDGKSAADLPEGITDGNSLSDFLNHFTKDKLPSGGTLGFSNSGTGNKFEELINAAYFAPEYTPNEDNEVYLLYTSYYDGITADDDQTKTLTHTMYLVPAATKFTFNLYNYRNQPVVLDGMTLRALNSYNYIFAQLAESEKVKTLEDESLWWVDWLEKVGNGTNNAWEKSEHSIEDLDDYNQKVGWIENYFLPLANESTNSPIDISLEKYNGEIWKVDQLRNIEEPPVITITRYFTESKNLGKRLVLDEESNSYYEVDGQLYQVQFKVHEIREGNIEAETSTSAFMNIDNLYALFRGTHVIIEVDMYESVVQVFCLIEEWGWNETIYKGYVQEDDD